ncbi:endolytic transglycosylase MltG [Catellatospora sichuanensis]|uniref:endolytic transglycosylase MltG n=1 Tax=Catellatospora sichuanensis TaxID=1969805 RepID=UPI001182A7C3|nr:endolytic transglycosylase MltG [Catellatospora sichuanensis]
MTDELFLSFEEHPERGQQRRRHAVDDNRGRNNKKKKKKKKRGRGRSFLALFLTLFLLGGLAGGAYLGYDKIKNFLVTPDYTSAATSAEVEVTIKEGSAGLDMAKALKAQDVIKSEQAFIEAWEKNPDAKKIQPGLYKLRVQISAADAITMLLDTKNRLVKGILIAEGLSTFKIYKLLAEKLGIPEADFKAAAKDPIGLGVPAWWFKREDGKKESRSIEGFLFPDTYEFPKNVTAKSALAMMVERFMKVTGDMGYADAAAKLNISPYQALIVASLAQAEAGNADDLGKVARVSYNRVFSEKAVAEIGTCHCLQFDVTVNYSREMAGKKAVHSSELTQAELTDAKNPYNRNAKGLPPTPINNPGKKALEGAADPPKGDWIYFVAIDKEGHSAFSATHTQFCKDNQTAVKNGALERSSC